MGVMYRHATGFGFATSFASHGHLFVDFFFMLSGFVLGLSVDPKLRAGARPSRFLEARVRRLWPVMAIGTLLGAVLAVWGGSPLAGIALLPISLALIPTLYIPGALFPLNPVAWSLSMELIANAFHAFVLSRVGQRLLAMVVGFSGILLLLLILRHEGNIFGNRSETWLPGMPRLAFSYGFGLLLARERLAGDRLRRLRLPWWLCFTLPPTAVFFLPALMPGGSADALVTLVLLPILFACATNSRLPAEVTPTFTGLGLLSYPLYAVHLPIMAIVALWCPPLFGRFVGPMAALVVAAMLAHFFERRAGQRSLHAPVSPITAGAGG